MKFIDTITRTANTGVIFRILYNTMEVVFFSNVLILFTLDDIITFLFILFVLWFCVVLLHSYYVNLIMALLLILFDLISRLAQVVCQVISDTTADNFYALAMSHHSVGNSPLKRV